MQGALTFSVDVRPAQQASPVLVLFRQFLLHPLPHMLDGLADFFGGPSGQHPNVTRLAVKDMPGSGKPQELLDAAGISASHIVDAVKAVR